MATAGSLQQRDYAGKIAVVTGAGSGIGRSTAKLLAQRGAKVHLADINAESVEKVRDEIRLTGGDAVAHTLDTTDADAVEVFAAAVFAEDSAVDLLHSNAGIGHGAPIEDTTIEDWRRVIGVNLMGFAYMMQAFVPRMLEQGRDSHVLNTASMAGLTPSAGMAVYATTKAAVVGMSEALDAELGSRGIRVTALCPGIIDTAIVKDSTMRGRIGARQDKLVDFYRKRGTSPDVVARQALDGVKHKRIIQPSPYHQVMPMWIVKRISPRAYQALNRRVFKLLFPAGR
ncbi:MAG: SDR family NAD(P)-dependent oxidoreductase [Actinobacteria bacterium]|nr:SDR family NAD(P)-dependent oxidoreductase [Actinomycetota bacterium]